MCIVGDMRSSDILLELYWRWKSFVGYIVNVHLYLRLDGIGGSGIYNWSPRIMPQRQKPHLSMSVLEIRLWCVTKYQIQSPPPFVHFSKVGYSTTPWTTSKYVIYLLFILQQIQSHISRYFESKLGSAVCALQGSQISCPVNNRKRSKCMHYKHLQYSM